MSSYSSLARFPTTPPSTPRRHHSYERRHLRDIRDAEQQSPHRRRVPTASYVRNSATDSNRNENAAPSTSSAPRNAYAEGQIRRRERERRQHPENAPPARPKSITRCLAQQRRRERERAEKARRSQMDVDSARLSLFFSFLGTKPILKHLPIYFL